MKAPYVIVVAHQKGGVGKSTIAANLAVELTKKNEVSVIDLDTQRSLTYFNSLRARNGFANLDIKKIESSGELKTAINDNDKILLIDVGGFDSDMNRVAILGADVVITPVSDSGIELVGLLSFRNILREIRKHRPDLQARVVLNRIHTRAGASLEEIYAFIDKNDEFALFSAILRDRADYKKAFDAGKSVVETSSKAAIEINELLKELENGQN